MNGTSDVRVISRADSVGVAIFVFAGVAIAFWTVWQAVVRIIELARATDVPVSVEFLGTPVQASVSGTSIPVDLDRGIVTIADLGTPGVVTGILGQILFVVTIVGVVFCLVALSANLMRARVFGRTNTVLVMTGGILGLVGTAASAFCDNMLANSAMAQLVDGPDTAVIAVEPFPFILAAFAVSIVGTVFVVGARLQRETEGLV